MKKLWKRAVGALCLAALLFSFAAQSVSAAKIGGGVVIPVNPIQYTFCMKYVDEQGLEIDASLNSTGKLTGSGNIYLPEIKEISGYTYRGFYYENNTGTNSSGSLSQLLLETPPQIHTRDTAPYDFITGCGKYTVYMVYAQNAAPQEEVRVTYAENGATGGTVPMDNRGYNIGQNAVVLGNTGNLTKNGYVFSSWNTAADGRGDVYIAGNSILMETDVTLYAQWQPDQLETERHIRYLQGYPDQTVQAGKAITRAEAATILFRLLSDTAHPNKNQTVAGVFSDVPAGQWYAQAVNYLASAGIIDGYSDNTYRPNRTITRAEFTKMVSRFDNLVLTSENRFSDVSDSHWAVQYINSAYQKNWIQGYPDGTFKPEKSITRAEVASLVNRRLNRAMNEEAIAHVKNPYKDINSADWRYKDIIEASVDHEYTRDAEGKEIWMNK